MAPSDRLLKEHIELLPRIPSVREGGGCHWSWQLWGLEADLLTQDIHTCPPYRHWTCLDLLTKPMNIFEPHYSFVLLHCGGGGVGAVCLWYNGENCALGPHKKLLGKFFSFSSTQSPYLPHIDNRMLCQGLFLGLVKACPWLWKSVVFSTCALLFCQHTKLKTAKEYIVLMFL